MKYIEKQMVVAFPQRSKHFIQKIKLFGMIFLLSAAMLTLNSCSKENQLEGNWRITSFIANGNGNNDMPGKIWTFNDGGSCYLSFAEDAVVGQWTISGDNLSIYGTLDNYYMINATLNIDEIKSNSMKLSGNIYVNDGSSSGAFYMIASFSKI